MWTVFSRIGKLEETSQGVRPTGFGRGGGSLAKSSYEENGTGEHDTNFPVFLESIKPHLSWPILSPNEEAQLYPRWLPQNSSRLCWVWVLKTVQVRRWTWAEFYSFTCIHEQAPSSRFKGSVVTCRDRGRALQVSAWPCGAQRLTVHWVYGRCLPARSCAVQRFLVLMFCCGWNYQNYAEGEEEVKELMHL